MDGFFENQDSLVYDCSTFEEKINLVLAVKILPWIVRPQIDWVKFVEISGTPNGSLSVKFVLFEMTSWAYKASPKYNRRNERCCKRYASSSRHTWIRCYGNRKYCKARLFAVEALVFVCVVLAYAKLSIQESTCYLEVVVETSVCTSNGFVYKLKGFSPCSVDNRSF